MQRSTLSVVKPGDVTQVKPLPENVKDATEATERELLLVMRRKIATEIDAGVPAHTLAPLMRQLRDLDKEVRAMDARAKQEGGASADADDEAWDAEAL